jgi:alkylation response protein AidB-like acyl-CoA dehydrogenase
VTGTETVATFRGRAEQWIKANLPSYDEPEVGGKELQRRTFDGGFAGIAFPEEYGGAGLTLEHHQAFYDAAHALQRQVPLKLMVSVGMLAPTLLDHGSHEAKSRFLPPLLRADDEWIQLLSEPRGGSDMAGATTRLTRDGDTYVLNGAKMWSTGAYRADYGLCLCRSDWDAPKHRGLSMVAVPLQATPGVTIEQTRTAAGRLGEFCQEFFDDVVLPSGNLIGEENQGWVVAQTLLFHERNAVGNVGYGYFGPAARSTGHAPFEMMTQTPSQLAAIAARRGTLGAVGSRLAEAYVDSVVGPLTEARIMTGMRAGTHTGQWGSLLKLQWSESAHEAVRTSLAALGPDAVIWDGEEIQLDNAGTVWLGARGVTIGGGSSEIQRNIISERLLGLPREPSDDRDRPFRDIMRTKGT